jgi:Ras-related protein Rab-1A
MFKYKIILAGAKNVGKSSLIARYCDNVFNENMMDTIGVAFKRKKIDLEDQLSLDVNIWDMGGEEKYKSLFPQYIKGATAALILYDTTRKETIEDVSSWVQIINDYGNEDIIKILIGTKIDLKDQREITKKEAEKHCAEHNWSAEVIETSAKTGENVEDTFLNVANEIVGIYFQKCSGCGDYFSKKLKICSNCGKDA